jgi:hypothetical protein
VNDLRTLTGLLDHWVTVKHPDDPRRVWQGRLTEVWDQWSIVLETPGGGRETFPAAFDISPTNEPQPGPAGAPRPWTDLRNSGLLWLINRTALHPRGVALAVHTDDRGAFTGWSLITNDEGEPWQFDPATDNDGYERAEATLAAARARLLDCGLCYEENGEEVHPHPECPKSARPAVVDARTHLVEGSRYPAAALCCVCGGGPVVYDNYLDQLFCWRCADCDCGRDGPCIRTGLHRPQAWACTSLCLEPFHGRARCERHHDRHPDGTPGLWHEGTSQDGSTLFWKDGDPGTTPDTCPDTDSPDTPRTALDTDTTAPVLTSTDIVRTACPDNDPDPVREDDPDTARTTCPDTVRTVWTARVPRRQMGAALAEAFAAITRATPRGPDEDTAAVAPDEPGPPAAEDTYLGPDGLTDTERERKVIRATVDTELSRPGETAHWELTLAISDALRTMPRYNPTLPAPGGSAPSGDHPDHTSEIAALRARVGELATALADILGHFTVHADVGGKATRTGYLDPQTIERWRSIQTGKGPADWTFPHVAGICPTCRREGLFLGSGGCVTCSHDDCRRPDAATTVLDDPPSTAHTCNRPDCADLLRRTLARALRYKEAYDWLRADVTTVTRYIARQRGLSPLGTGDTRNRALTNLATWLKDPGPLDPPATP